MLARRQVYELHAALVRNIGDRATWTLFQLLRAANGNDPFPGRQVEPEDVFTLHVGLTDMLDPDAAWTAIEILREALDSQLPNGTPWPSAIQRDPEA